MKRSPLLPAALLACAGLALADGTHLGTNYCTSTPNSGGGAASIEVFGPDYGGTGQVFLDDAVVISAFPLPPETVGLFLYATQPAQLPFGDGFLCVAGQVQRMPAHTSLASGLIYDSVTLGDLPGLTAGTWHFQAWFRDVAGGPAGFNLSDGIALTVSG